MSAKLHITGTVCSVEPIKYFESNSCVLKFKVVTPNVEKKKDGDEYAPSNFYTVELWNKSATAMEPQIFVSSAEKRCKVYVVGDHVVRNWETADGKKGVEELIKNANVEPYEWQKSEDGASQTTTNTKRPSQPAASKSESESDDVPF